jgi:hypothetical protein
MKIKLDFSPNKITVAQYVGYTMSEGDTINQVQSITNLPRKQVIQLTPAQLTEIKEAFDTALNSIPSVHVPKWNGYGFVPDINAITFGEWLDLDSNCNDFPKNLNKILAILFRPIKSELNKRYTIEEYDSTNHLPNAVEFNDMPLAIANGAMVFFSSIEKELLIHFQESSQRTAIAEMEKAMKIMQEAMQQQTN